MQSQEMKICHHAHHLLHLPHMPHVLSLPLPFSVCPPLLFPFFPSQLPSFVTSLFSSLLLCIFIREPDSLLFQIWFLPKAGKMVAARNKPLSSNL